MGSAKVASLIERSPELVALVRKLRRRNPKTGERKPLRTISAEHAVMGYLNIYGLPFAAESVKSMAENL